MRLTLAALRLAAHALPADVRGQHAEEIAATLQARCRAAAGWGLAAIALLEGWNLLVAGARARAGRGPLRGPRPKRWHRGRALTTAADDLRSAVRGLRSDPRFALTAVITLGLGIGASTAIFSLADSAYLRPLPFSTAHELASLMRASERGISNRWAPAPLERWRELGTFSAVEAFDLERYDLSGGGAPEQIQVARVTPGMLSMLDVAPTIGRGFLAGEGGAGSDHLVLLSFGLAQTRFGDPVDALGETIRLNGEAYLVIGVMARGFTFPYQFTRAWVPWSLTNRSAAEADATVQAYVRLRPGVSRAAAQDRIDRIAAQAEPDSGLGARLFPPTRLDTRLGYELAILISASGLLLLIACANVANLMLSRTVRRARELAVRAAVGAARGRLLRESAIESLLLAALGGLAGIASAFWLLGPVARLAPSRFSGFTANAVDLDTRGLAYALLAALVTSLLFGLLPTLRAARANPVRALSGCRDSGGPGVRRTRRILVASEVAVSVVLLVGAGLLLVSLQRLRAVDFGFVPDALFAVDLAPSSHRYSSVDERVALFRQVAARVRAVPGVDTAAYALGGPPDGAAMSFGLHPEADGQPPAAYEDDQIWAFNEISAGYFDALGIPILEGRDFSEREVVEGAAVIIVNEATARTFWPGSTALGGRFRADPDGRWLEVVGVVGDTRSSGPTQPFGPTEWYVPLSTGDATYATVFVRSRGDVDIDRVVRETVTALDPEQPLGTVASMADRIEASFQVPRFYLLIVGAFAAAAALLAAIGIYAVVAYAVTLRSHELGIRLALGAGSRRVVGIVMREGAMMVAAGIVVGLLASMAAGRYLGSLLFGVAAADPGVMAAVVVGIVVVATGACLLPARRALTVDPATTLRAQ